jgi:hypothetical protein
VDINKEMFPVYSGKCLSCKVVHNWVKKFSQGHLKVAGAAQPCHSVDIAIITTVQWGEELIRVDMRITMESETALGCSHSLAYSMMHKHLKFWKV